LSPPRTPQCNGVVERANKSIIEMTRTMISDSKIPMDFWAEAVCTAAYIRNRIKSTSHGKTSYEMWNNRKPNIKCMRRFGCLAYLLNKENKKKKFELKCIKGIFVGYSANNTYRVYIPEIGKIRSDCDVKFDEGKNGQELLNRWEENHLANKKNLIVVGLDEDIKENVSKEQLEENEDMQEDGRSETEESNDEYESTEDFEDFNRNNYNEENQLQEERARNKGRPIGTTKDVKEVRSHIQRKENRRRDLEQNVRRSERIKNQQAAMLSMDEEIPKNMKEAKESNYSKYWKQAIDKELASMKKHEVWKIVPRLQGKRVIKNEWVFNIKEDPDTTIQGQTCCDGMWTTPWTRLRRNICPSGEN
ncbi:Copia protein, partial [Ooceraea biroi]